MIPSITHPIGDFIRGLIPIPELAFLVNALICIMAILAVGIGSAPVLIYMERKVCAHVQCRLGPMRLGWHGVMQLPADIIKLLFKEVYAPGGVDKFVYYLAPLLSLTAPFLCLCMIPYDSNLQVANLSIGIPFILAMNGLGVFAILLAGWSSNNKYSLLGALRSGAQMISYEVSLALLLLFVVMMSGSASLQDIVAAQNGHLWDWWIFKAPLLGFLAFVLYMVVSTAELNRAPFDIAEAEQELTGGYHTEYTGMAFSMFYLNEYINMMVTASLGAVCFLGGYHAPLIGIAPVDQVLSMVPGFVWMAAKIFFQIWLYMMFRWTWVRPRIDQLMSLEWKFLLPLNLLLLSAGAICLALGCILP